MLKITNFEKTNEMKRIFIIVLLFVSILNSFGQELERDIIYVDDQLWIKNVLFEDWLEDSAASATARDAGSGMSLDGNSLDWGGSALNKNVSIQGAGHAVEIGTSGSKIQAFNVNSSSDIAIYSDGDVYIGNNGVEYLMQGNQIINNNTGDIVAYLDDISDSIAANTELLPFNFTYTFNSSTVDSRPGIGLFRLNNATLASVTEIYIDYFDINSISKSNFLAELDTGSVVSIITDENNYALYRSTGGYVDNGNYYTYKVEYKSHNGVITGTSVIDLEVSNSTGSGGGGAADRLVNATDTIILVNDTLFLDGTNGSTASAIKAEYTESEVSSADTFKIQDAGQLYGGSNNPTGTLRTNLNGTLVPYNVWAASPSSILGNAVVQGTYTGSSSVAGVRGVATDGGIGVIAETVTNGGVAFVTKSVSTDNINSAFIHVSDTILKITPDIIYAETMTAKLGGVSVGGSEAIDTTYDSKYVIENTEVDKLQFNPTTQAYSEGTVFYDTSCKALTIYNDIPAFKEELGRGINVRFYNGTASTITDGTVVRSIGVHINSDINFEGDLAGNASLDSILGVAVATNDVLPGEHGMATVLGQVNGLNTSAFSDNDIIYVGHAGTFTNVPPEPPLWYQILGRVVYADNDSGAIYIKTGETKYSPAPTFTARFEDSTETITNPGLGVYEQITSATYSLFEEKRNVGFEFQGDSISPMQDGNYTIFLSYSFQGTVSQTDLYRIGTFIDGAKEYSTSRTASGTNNGGVPYPVTVFLNAGQWISFRVKNETSGVRDCVFTDGTITINYSE